MPDGIGLGLSSITSRYEGVSGSSSISVYMWGSSVDSDLHMRFSSLDVFFGT